ncbi:MAG: hypothetical protein MUP49_00280 [Dehalococcoidia bacterium]|nr:hypothetical protein [Dehalococcoidia bacterium]
MTRVKAKRNNLLTAAPTISFPLSGLACTGRSRSFFAQARKSGLCRRMGMMAVQVQ